MRNIAWFSTNNGSNWRKNNPVEEKAIKCRGRPLAINHFNNYAVVLSCWWSSEPILLREITDSVHFVNIKWFRSVCDDMVLQTKIWN